MKRRIAQPQPTEQQLNELAGLISAVLNNPATPDEIVDGISEGMSEVYNYLGGEGQTSIDHSPTYIALLLKANVR